jgi:hypothetical protein
MNMAQFPTTFYSYIERKYDRGTRHFYKQFATLNDKNCRAIARKNFLLECRRIGVIPSHTTNFMKSTNHLMREDSRHLPKLQKLMTTWKKRTLSIEIKDALDSVASITERINCVKAWISRNTLRDDWLNFFMDQERHFYKTFKDITKNNTKKLKNLKLQQIPVMECPKANDNWLVNYTDVTLPTDMQVLLSYGEKFSVYEGIEKINYYHLIADVENVISRTIEDESLKNVARTDVAGIIKSYVSHGGAVQTPADKLFRDVTVKSMKFIKEYHQDENVKEIFIARSDKCNQIVVLYKEDYLCGMRKLIDDPTSYRVTDRNMTVEACNAVRSLAKEMQEWGYIDRAGFLNLVVNNAYAPRIYGLVKTHKADVSRHNLNLRPVVSYIGSPLTVCF